VAYITAADLRDYIGASSHADDIQLGHAADRAQHMVDAYCNRVFRLQQIPRATIMRLIFAMVAVLMRLLKRSYSMMICASSRVLLMGIVK
jgi:hypothetical protein